MELPLHIAWSGMTSYDMSKPRQRMGLYRTVLHEGLLRRPAPLPQPGPSHSSVAGAAHPRRSYGARCMGRRLPSARLPHPGNRVTDIPGMSPGQRQPPRTPAEGSALLVRPLSGRKRLTAGVPRSARYQRLWQPARRLLLGDLGRVDPPVLGLFVPLGSEQALRLVLLRIRDFEVQAAVSDQPRVHLVGLLRSLG